MTESPSIPTPAVLAVLHRGDAVLLVRRANPPDAGLWGFPGGKVERGETLAQATERELLEETGITARACEPITALDVLDEEKGQLRHHYILIALRCEDAEGEPRAGDDALEVRWVPLAGLDDLPLSRDVARLARMTGTR
ncbi:NUDIX hydrolase [Salipiger pacificus]|nr:NUDIX hydrolase [Alloyangia pacifica]MCA0947791.1 NUDIX hydrolase [Alloyangia pacifica]